MEAARSLLESQIAQVVRQSIPFSVNPAALWACPDGQQCPTISDCKEFDFCGRGAGVKESDRLPPDFIKIDVVVKRPIISEENATSVTAFAGDRYEVKAAVLGFDPDPMFWPVSIDTRLGNSRAFRLQQKGPKGTLYVQDGTSLELLVLKG